MTGDGQRRIVCVSVDPDPRKHGAPHRPFKAVTWGDCVADVAPGSQVLITVGNREQRHPVIVPDDPGAELEIRILPPDRTEQRSGAIALFVVGGAAAVGGFFAYELASIGGASGTTVPAVVMLGGIALVVTGIFVIATGPREPVIELGQRLAPRAVRRDDALGDLAVARRREASSPPPERAPVFGYTLEF